MFKISTSYFLSYFILILSLHSEDSENISLRFQIASIDRINQNWNYRSGEKTFSLRVSNRSFSRLYHYQGPPSTSFFLSFNEEGGESEADQKIASVNFPKGISNRVYLLVVEPVGNRGMVYPIRVLDRDQVFPKDNQVMIINRLNQPIRFLAGTTVFDVMPEKSITQFPKPIENNRFHAQLYALKEGKPYKAFEGYPRLGPSKSILALIRTHPKIPSKILFQPITYKNYEHPINLIKHPPAELIEPEPELMEPENNSYNEGNEDLDYGPSNEDL